MIYSAALPTPDLQRHRLPSLTGLRFVAAFLVFMFHMTLIDSPLPPNAPVKVSPFANHTIAQWLGDTFGRSGMIGVSFFFVLSGFVLTWSAKPGEPATAFWRRRLLKVFPAHLATWAFVMVFLADGSIPAKAWLPNLFLLHAWFPDPSVFMCVNLVAWTLSCELLFYVLFPLVIAGLRRIPVRHLWGWIAGLMVVMVAVQAATAWLVPDTPATSFGVSNLQFWFGDFLPPLRLPEFVIGALLALAVRAGRDVPVPMPAAVALCLAGFVVQLYVPFVLVFNVTMILPICALIVSAVQRDVAGRSGWLGGRTMTWLGEVSFGFYLCQGITVFYGRNVVGHSARYETPVATAVFIGFFLATLMAGWILYVAVERPVMRRFARSRRPVMPSPVDPVPREAAASAAAD
ncbi:acyltransferase [Streptomyces sp. WELS2]|uniref:acyltransferase family protein n=1 Tax=Streptomyces sp. WELS2 TaxID=2749435 RepID=UPI0015F0C47A|nr:acyltransferase [Streptomyces sp. WELS2]